MFSNAYLRLADRPYPRPVLKATRPGRSKGSVPVLLALLAAALGAAPAGAQTKRCDLVGRDTTVSGNPTAFKHCLDLSSLDGKTVNVPMNVTRIDNDGLSLCKASVQSGGNADIVYVYDNSGSMAGYTSTSSAKASRRAWVGNGGADTLFYYDDGNCADKSLSGSVVFSRWDPSGTAMVLDTVSQLGSNSSCTDFSGDPYNSRGRAFRLGIQDQADRAPSSTAGIMSFNNSVGNNQVPLSLGPPANVATLQSRILANAGGGTNYTAPLDTSRNWLRNSAYTSQAAGRNKAIIFLSDGRPDNTNYLPMLDATMPTIYGIFLHKDTVGSGRMQEMARLTGGKFFLIPPNDPDSLNSVVDQILNIILLEYDPQTASVTNTSLSPTQSATSSPSDFALQADGSWLMKLSDIIGLKRNASNSISFTTTFKEKTSGATNTQTINFTIATTQADIGTTQKIGTTQFGATCYDRSSLSILNAAGARPAFFTDTNTVYQIRIRTAPTPLDSALASALSGVKGDAESPVLKPPFSSSADSLVFKKGFPFQAALGTTKTNGNGALESGLFDSIIVAWTHPRDAQDFVADTMRVRARGQNAQMWFSLTNGGPTTAQFPASASTVYVVVQDQSPDPRKTYTAIVTSEAFSLDKETVTLSELTPGSGTLVGQIAISNAGKVQADGKLEISVVGDQLRATYKDPVDGDSAQATAGFDQAVQEAPALRFTDAAGNPLTSGTIWSPANGKLYFDYSDDDVKGTLATQSISLTLASKKYGAVLATDHERVSAGYAGSLTATRGHWKGVIDLNEGTAIDSNGKAETSYRGEATIAATAHDNAGNAQNLAVSDFLVIAYPDSQASIQWKLDSTVTANEGLIVTVGDQTFTVNQKDTVQVSITCTQSGDSVSGIPAIEGPTATSGVYVSGTVTKDEGTPNLGDKVLSCLSTDQLRIRYVDPVYGTLTELVVDEAAKPVATPPGRKFIASELVSLSSATPGATIWYTLDGSTPIPGKSAVYAQPIRISVTTTLKAIASKPGFKDSKVMTEIYTKEFTASRLEILDENGNAIPGGVLTGSAQGVRIKLITTQDNLTSTEAPATLKVSGDAENLLLGNFASLGTSIQLSTSIALRSPAAKAAGDDTLQAASNDTLIVRWVNPFNAADVAADTVVIKPAFVAADVYFSATDNGPRITQYPVNTDTVYIVVKTRPRDPALTYNVVLTSSDGSGDREVVPLTEVSPGVFTGKEPVGTDAKAKADGIIQVAAAGDQLTAVFTDPVYHDQYRGDAGFARQVQESAQLDFIDENGIALAPGTVWSPAKGKVYLRYSDDWNAGIDSLVHSQTVRLNLVNRKSGDSVGADTETLVIQLKSHTATRGIWEGSLDLADNAKAKAGNDTLESYYLGKLHASITPHDNGGAADPGDATDTLDIAYPDQPAEIVVRDTSGGKVERKTDQVDIIIHDQLVTKSGEAAITATVSCGQSGDRVDKIILVWNGSAYEAKPPLAKGDLSSGKPDKSDSVLECRENDKLTVTYIDPVYGTPRTGEAGWTDDTPAEMWYASAKDGSRISSASDGMDDSFVIVVKGVSPSRDKIDTVQVVLTIAKNDSEVVEAVETGPFTGEFRTTAKFRFQTNAPKSLNGTVETLIDPKARVNQAIVNGSASISGIPVKADLALLSVFDLALSAWAKDADGDGRADRLYFRFDHTLSRLPDGLPAAYWNAGSDKFKQKADAAQLSFAKGDSSLIIADFSKSPFGLGLTGIPERDSVPYAVFPNDNLFGGQSAPLADSVGPIPLTAIKLPSDGKTYVVTQDERRFDPDTLRITVSEKIRTGASMIAVFRFSKGCKDYSESVPLKLFGLPEISSDGIIYTAVVDNALETQTPLVGDCIFLETDGRFTDMPGNVPSQVGVPITGTDPKLVIRAFKGYPPVAGLDAGNAGFTVANQDNLSDGTFRKEVGIDRNVEVIWVPPVGFDASDPVRSLDRAARDFDNPQAGDRSGENAHPVPMPPGISTVQVITSTAYLARITIFDNLGNFVRTMSQAFGHNGELRNGSRTVDGGQVSFLVWDMKDSHGNRVGQGVYVWKVNFTFEDKNKKSEVRYTRTGVLGH